jgi:hypothetical protein
MCRKKKIVPEKKHATIEPSEKLKLNILRSARARNLVIYNEMLFF